VLRARGSEFEPELGFGPVHQLLEPVLVQAGGDERARLLPSATNSAGVATTLA